MDVLAKGMQSQILVHPCDMNGFTKKHNRLLHSENQMDEGSHAVNVSAATINQCNQVTSFLQIVPVSVQSGDNRLTSFTFLDSGSLIKVSRINYKPKAWLP